MATETITSFHTAGANVYLSVWDGSGQVLDFNDDTFKTLGTATTPYQTMTERTDMGGGSASGYQTDLDLSRVNSTPDPGVFVVSSYERAGGTPAPGTDPRINDVEIRVYNSINGVDAGAFVEQNYVWVRSSINDGTPTDVSFATNLASAVDDIYKEAWLVFNTGAAAGACRKIHSYDGTTKTLTFDRPFPVTPSDTDQFSILAVQAGVHELLLGRLADVEDYAVVTPANRLVLGAVARLRNRVDFTSSPGTVYKTDDATPLFTQTLTFNTTAVPIVEVDTD